MGCRGPCRQEDRKRNILRKRKAEAEQKPRAVRITDDIRESVRRVLPFRLTGDQKKVIAEIVADLQRMSPMNRLLQGDVGSGPAESALGMQLTTAFQLVPEQSTAAIIVHQAAVGRATMATAIARTSHERVSGRTWASG